MKINFIPKTFLGKCSVVLIIMMPIFFYVGMSSVDFYLSTPAGGTILRDIIARPGIALSMIAGFVCGITAFFIGIIATLKKKDYSILVFLSGTLGFLTLLLLLAEFLFPH